MRFPHSLGLVLILSGIQLPRESEANDTSRTEFPTPRGVYRTNSFLIMSGNCISGGGPREFEQGFSVIGVGTIEAPVVIFGGNLYPGYKRPGSASHFSGDKDPIGTFKFGRDFRMEPEGVVNIDVRSPLKRDQVHVGGSAKLSGTLKIRYLGYHPKPGDRIPILKARKIFGDFKKVEVPKSSRYPIDFVKRGNTGFLVVRREGRPGRL